MIYGFNQQRWPEAVYDERLFHGLMVDGDRVLHDCATPNADTSYAMRVDTVTGHVTYALRYPDGGVIYDEEAGEVRTGSLTLTPPILMYSKGGELLNPQDVPVSIPEVLQ